MAFRHVARGCDTYMIRGAGVAGADRRHGAKARGYLNGAISSCACSLAFPNSTASPFRDGASSVHGATPPTFVSSGVFPHRSSSNAALRLPSVTYGLCTDSARRLASPNAILSVTPLLSLRTHAHPPRSGVGIVDQVRQQPAILVAAVKPAQRLVDIRYCRAWSERHGRGCCCSYLQRALMPAWIDRI